MGPRPVLKRVGYFLLALVAFVLVISFYAVVIHHDSPVVPISLVALLAYLVWMFFFYYPRQCRKIFRQQKAMQIPYSYIVTDEAMVVKSEISDERLPWNYFIRWKEGENLFMAYQSDVNFRLFPKRCFTSPEEMAQFRQLLQAKLGPAGV